MNSNKFYTIMIVPEKTSPVRKIVVPAWVTKIAAVAFAFTVLLGTVMFYDYWYVMNEISENKQLKMENRRLRQQVQVFKNKVATIESTMERVKTFATRLKVITNIEDRGGLLQSLNQTLPDASVVAVSSTPLNANSTANSASTPSSGPQKATVSANVGFASIPMETDDPEDEFLRKDYDDLDSRLSLLGHDSLFVETELQDLYELLGDQKAFLSALPTRRPAIGYFTSGFGVRKSPIGGAVKMHEGLDIANHVGTAIRAPADGIVTFADVKSGYGRTVVLDHGYGLETWYGHAQKLMVSKGQHVRRGEVIAQMGSTGRSTGPHVHYEVRVNGYPVNPLSYILEN
jgi:murein DD-endopeptidase MepM/ murein hydrolase activator NlpD